MSDKYGAVQASIFFYIHNRHEAHLESLAHLEKQVFLSVTTESPPLSMLILRD